MKTRIRVYGKDQNRTALGIINAYLKLNPDSTLEDLQRTFPYSLNPTGSIKQLIASIAEAAQKPDEFFEKPDELITLKNGEKVSLKYLWKKENFEAIKKHAELYGIEVASITETPPFTEGSYKLEMIDKNTTVHAKNAIVEEVIVDDLTTGEEYIIIEEVEPEMKTAAHHTKPQKTHAMSTPPPEKKEKSNKKNNNWWLWLLFLLLLLLCFLGWRKCSQKKAVEEIKTIEEVSIIPSSETITEEIYSPYWKDKIADAFVTESGELIYGKAGQLVGIVINGETVNFDKLSTEAEVNAFLNSDLKESGWIVLDRVHFKFNGINLTDDALNQIKNISAILNTYAPNASIAIEGFSDHVGTSAENQIVSNERAEETKKHFILNGFPEEKITSATGLGDMNRLCQADDTPLCRAQNRRAEIKITK